MSADPSLQLQGALVTLLKADSGVDAVAGDRVYDKPPQSPTFPYITLGDSQVLPDKADCVDGTEVFVTIDAWSRAVGYPEVKRLASAIVLALDDVAPTLDDFTVVDFQLEQMNFLRDPDGITRHASIVFRALIDAIA